MTSTEYVHIDQTPEGILIELSRDGETEGGIGQLALVLIQAMLQVITDQTTLRIGFAPEDVARLTLTVVLKKEAVVRDSEVTDQMKSLQRTDLVFLWIAKAAFDNYLPNADAIYTFLTTLDMEKALMINRRGFIQAVDASQGNKKQPGGRLWWIFFENEKEGNLAPLLIEMRSFLILNTPYLGEKMFTYFVEGLAFWLNSVLSKSEAVSELEK